MRNPEEALKGATFDGIHGPGGTSSRQRDGRDDMKSQRERADEAHAEKLRAIDAAISEGRLVIRAMTAEERKRFPPRSRLRQRRHPRAA